MISVLIPAYNAEKYISEAIESVLNQTYKNLEIIVVDDGSADKTRRVVESFGNKVKYHYQNNSGPGTARNVCINLSKGEYLAFLDADDIWTKNKLELQMAEFQSQSTLEAIFGMVRQVHQKVWTEKIRETNIPRDELMKGFIQSAMLIKRESFLRIGMFPEDTKVGEFVDWLLRAKELNLQMKLLPELFLFRRIHQTNLGIRKRSEINEYVKIVKKSIDRRRINNLK